jgi:hypothetical protein
MILATTIANALKNLRRAIERLILRVAPRHGSLDTVLHSYDDWRELQEQRPADMVNGLSTQDTPTIPTRPQNRTQRGPKPRHAFE